MNSRPNSLTLRDFLRRSAMAAALAGVSAPFNILHGQGGSPNGKMRLAMIGPGGKGLGGFGSALATGMFECTAICDVWDVNARKAQKRAPQATLFKDYRRMFDEIGDRLDAVYIATPDHSHFGPALLALQSKIPVYLEKPICRSFDQTNRLVASAREAGIVTQAGTQGMSSEGLKLLREWYEAGVLGEIKEVTAWCAASGMAATPSEFLPAEPVSPEIDWDLWLGPAPECAHNTGYYPTKWRFWQDWGTGRVADMGAHTFSALHYAFGLPYPKKVEVWTSNHGPLTYPQQSRVTYHIPGRPHQPAFKMSWYDGAGDNLPPKPPGWEDDRAFPPGKPDDWEPGQHFPANGGGAFIIGSKASAVLYDPWGLSCHIFPRAKFMELRSSLPAKTIPRHKGSHELNWAQAIRGDIPAASAPFEFAGHPNNLSMLGMIAVRLNRGFEFDAATETIPGDEEANRLLQAAGGYEARAGFPG